MSIEAPADIPADCAAPTPSALLRIEDVCAMLSVCRATVYKLTKTDPAFPKPHRLSPRAIRWRRDELKAWCDGLPVAGSAA